MKFVRHKKFYGRLFRFFRGLFRIFCGRFAIAGPIPEPPVIFVTHHQNMQGVLHALLWLNRPVHPWILWNFYERDGCYHQFLDYTLTKRLHWKRAFARPAARILSWICPGVSKSMRAIPVYRNMKKLRLTMRRSVEALKQNENLLIFPDINYADPSDEMGAMYEGFITLDRYYRRVTGRHIAFVPLRMDMANRRIEVGPPVFLREGVPFREERDRVADTLRRAMNATDSINTEAEPAKTENAPH